MKKATAHTTKPTAEEEKTTKAETKKSDFFQFRIPKPTFQDTPINAFLVLSLVILAFLLGMLTNKVIYLEQASKTPAANVAANTVPVETPYPTIPQYVDVDPGKLPLKGNKDAKVAIVEFSDFECPFCGKFFTDNMKQLDEKYIQTGKVKLYYRHYPLTSIHPLAQKAGEASECANEQGQFWGYHDKLFIDQTTWSALAAEAALTTFTDYAGQLGMNTDQFRTCLDSGKFAQRVTDDTAAGTQAQVDGTPTFFINGQRLVGAVPFADLQKLIDQELEKAK